MIINRTAAFCLLLTFAISSARAAPADRQVISLNGPWQSRAERPESAWKRVTLPARFEDHEGIEFEGIGTYRRTVPSVSLPDGQRAVLHFQAAATLAEVSVAGQPVGSHLGGWTPFRFDITEIVRSATPGEPLEVAVRLDEKTGHNSQGFLPIVAPHFGGIWQDVKLLIVSDTWLDDLSLLSIGDPSTGAVRIDVRVNGSVVADETQVAVRYRMFGADEPWSPQLNLPVVEAGGTSSTRASQALLDRQTGILSLECPVRHVRRWNPESPNLYELEVELQRLDGDELHTLDRVSARAAFRDFRADGSRLLLNGRPTSIRGILNWGYAPPRLGPSTDEAHMRDELAFARSCGFNLMKFCLWIPPKRYLELADEMGMMTWVEYPTWHSKWTPDQLPTLEREFSEFFRFDRNHPSVVLRSLTCETGPSADLNVIKSLYDLCHAMIPGSVVEDDSSWIGWNRIHDFYDDHPYGNNHTWVATLRRLKQYIAERERKPLVLGEAIAADTWVDRETLLSEVGDRRPFWLPGFLEGNQDWLQRMEAVGAKVDTNRLAQDSKYYAYLMRKYQIETYRREVPDGGYVVSVIRDFPLASMGLLDYLGSPKWPARAWRWHGDTMVILATEADRRSFAASGQLAANLIVSHFGPRPIQDATLTTSLQLEGGKAIGGIATRNVNLETGDVESICRLETELPAVTRPTWMIIRATLNTGSRSFENAWRLWIVPNEREPQVHSVCIHESCSDDVRAAFPGARTLADAEPEGIVVASRLDRPLIDAIERGRRVLLVPDGESNSLPLYDVWFLRGGPVIADHPFNSVVPRLLLVDLQHFDLAGPVVPDLEYLEQVSPILMFWDNHDLQRVKTHGLVFETRIGQGRLMVSTLNHWSSTSAAGQWLLTRLLEYLDTGAPPKNALSRAAIQRMREKVEEDKIELVKRSWEFRPDPNNQGLQRRWHEPDAAGGESWNEIRIGSAWEGLGYPSLDGWAWYRVQVDIPKSWSGRPIYVSFEGVDDYYQLYVNGSLAGSGGDIESRTTAFEERASHLVTEFVQPGEKALIAVRVYDWQGAGGIFRPVTVGTAAIGNGQTEVLK